jgi:hypothetical protein
VAKAFVPKEGRRLRRRRLFRAIARALALSEPRFNFGGFPSDCVWTKLHGPREAVIAHPARQRYSVWDYPIGLKVAVPLIALCAL